MDSPNETKALLVNGTKSYNSFRATNGTPPPGPCTEHQLQKHETLQGIAVKYGVKVGDILRANNMWAQDNIHLRKTLLIPLTSEKSGSEISRTEKEKTPPADHTPHFSAPSAPTLKAFPPTTSPLTYTAKFSSSPVLKSDPNMIAHFAQIDDELNPL